jgi:hypothetical protein
VITCEPRRGSFFFSLEFLCLWLSILHVELEVILDGADEHVEHRTESATFLTITMTANNQTEMSGAALSSAEEAINMIKTWSNAVDVMKQVMDAVGPIAAVCPIPFWVSFAELTGILQLQPYANLAWSLLSKIPGVRLLALSWDTVHSHCFRLAARLCYSRFSVIKTSEHYSWRYGMGLNLQRMPTL